MERKIKFKPGAKKVSLGEKVENLRGYIQKEYHGKIPDALESIGGVKLVRKILGLKDFAVMDPKLYEIQ